MYQMLQALRYCHARLIIHRDLKPQNVMVDVNRQIVKLTDFELAKTFGYPRRELTSKVTPSFLNSILRILFD